MNGESQLLVTDEPVEVQDFCRILDHVKKIYKIYLKLTKKRRKITTHNRLDLETLEH